MKEGRELDALIAERVMGVELPKWLDAPHGLTTLTSREIVPDYSTDISAAWLVIGEMERRGYWCEMRTPFMEPFKDDGYWTGFTPHGTSGWNGTPDHWTHTESMPLSICLAALKAIEEEAQGNA